MAHITRRMLRGLLAPMIIEAQAQFNREIASALAEEHKLLRMLAARSGQDVTAQGLSNPPTLDYLGFEDRFRGSKAAIEERQTEYLDYFFDLGEILDIGCGRGEFLSMLQTRGTPARGIDADEDMVSGCREQGLVAECGDALEYLEAQPDGAFGGVFMSQVVEHLSTDYLVALLDAIKRKTSRRAVLIVETLNPQSLSVLTRWYWLDPTHVRLVHPETLQYLMEQAGFATKTVQFRRPADDTERLPRLDLSDIADDELTSFNETIGRVNARLFGPLDYFVVGQRFE